MEQITQYPSMPSPYLLPSKLIPKITAPIKDSLPQKVALVTGITGQDGLYLAAYLLFNVTEINYEVHGIIRKNSATIPILQQFQDHLNLNPQYKKRKLILHTGDVTDQTFILNLINKTKPDEIYNLAAQTHVQHSFEMPQHTFNVNTIGLLNICTSVLNLNLIAKTRIFQASTSEMFGDVQESKLNSQVLIDETFPFNPMSPYAVSKISAYYYVQYYRRVYGMFICTALSFNHESPLRHESFITKKITKGAARIKHKLQSSLKIGNLYAMRDWGHAQDYIKAYWLMLNKSHTPTDYVVATEQSVSVKEFAERAFVEAGFKNIEWKGEASLEKLVDSHTGQVLLEVDPEFYRPGEVPYLRGTYKKIKQELGWEPESKWESLLSEMLEYDMQLAEREVLISKISQQQYVAKL